MRGVRIPQDLNGEDQFVMGLSVTRLASLMFGLLAGYTLMHLGLPGPVRIALAIIAVALGAAGTWIRPEGRSLGHWVLAAIEFHFYASLQGRRQSKPVSAVQPVPRFSIVMPAPAIDATALVESGLDDDDVIELPDPVVPREPARASSLGDVADDAVPVYLGGTQVITFFAAKGGTGRTTLATEVATLLAAKGRYKASPGERPQPLRVALVDFDLSSANVSARLGLAQPTMLDYLSDIAGVGSEPDPRDYIVRHHLSNLDVLLGPSKCLAGDRSELLGIPQAARILSSLRSAGYQFLVVDMGASIGDLETYLLEAATLIYCVVTPTAGSVQSLYRGVEVLRRLGLETKLRYVANKMRDGYSLAEPMGDLGGSLAARVPVDPAFDLAENVHRPVVLSGKGTAEEALVRLAASIYPALERAAPERGINPFSWLMRRHRAS